ncbi:MAG: hypothetical protein ACRC7I_12095 [Selenomonadaceae bacterium]
MGKLTEQEKKILLNIGAALPCLSDENRKMFIKFGEFLVFIKPEEEKIEELPLELDGSSKAKKNFLQQ